MLKRREMLAGATALTAGAFGAARAQATKTLRFIPTVGLAILDPIANTSAPTRTHDNLVFDTLYILDTNYLPEPQMVEGHQIDDDGRTWTLHLRESASTTANRCWPETWSRACSVGQSGTRSAAR